MRLTSPGRYLTAILIAAATTCMALANGPDASERGRFSGTVVESVSRQPLDYVNVVLYSPDGERLITGGITDEEGHFDLKDLPLGSYRVTISFIGFKTHTIERVTITDREPHVDAGEILLEADERAVGEVVVRGERDMLTLNLDKRVFVVDRDLSTTGGSALDVMESLPSVTVDYEGRVSLRGSTNVTILVDGRPSQFVSLDQLPSTMIDRIEVISNPSARYDPDGTSGIINVIMKSQRQHGTGVMVNLNAGTGNRYNGSININRRDERLNIFGNYDMRINSNEGRTITNRERIVEQGDTLRQLYQYEEFFRRGYFHNIRGGVDFFVDDRNRLTFMATLNLRDTRPRNYSDVEIFLPVSEVLETSMERQFKGVGTELVLNYERAMGNDGGELVADLFYSATDGDTWREVAVFSEEEPLPRELGYLKSLAPGSLLTFQTDYTRPFSSGGHLEAGVKAILRNLEDDFRFYDEDPITGERTINDGFTNYFLFGEEIYSLYGIYSVPVGRFHLQGGLRAEQHNSDAEQRVTGEEFERSYFSLFPSAHVRYGVDNNSSLMLSYGRRVNRPGVSLLNPFVNYSDPMNISFGNPELKPEYINSYEVGYQYSRERTAVNAVLFFRETNDMISREMTLMGGENQQTTTTFRNLKHGTSYGVELAANHPLAPWWRVNGSFSWFYTRLEDERLADWDHEGDSYMFDLTSNWTIMKRFNLQARFHYHSPMVTAGTITGGGCQQHGGQGVVDEIYYLDLALRTDLLDGNGTLSLRLSDVFNTRGMTMNTFSESFVSTLSRTSQSRVLFFGFTYRFNDYRSRAERERERSLLDEIG